MKKIIISLISSKILFFLLFSFIILGLNLTPLIMQTKHSPPGRTFAAIHNNVQDFFFYKALMNEGANGQWLTTDPFTTEPHKASIVFSYFLWLGKIGKITHLSLDATYHGARILFGFLLFLSAFKLILALKIRYPRLAFLFFIFASPLLHDIITGNGIIKGPFMNWWTGMDAVRRAAYLPHHCIGGFLMVMAIFFIMKFFEYKNPKYIISAIICTIFLSFILTPSLFILLLSLPPAVVVYSAISLISDHKHQVSRFFRANSQFLFGIFFLCLLGAGSLLFMYAQTSLGFPWSQYIAWERRLQFPLQPEIFGALGILVPLAIMGVIKALLSKNFKFIFIASWFLSPILFIPLAPKLGMSNIRVIQGVPYLPLAILAILGLELIMDFIENIMPSEFQIINFKFLMNSKLLNNKLIKNYKLEIKNYILPITALIIFTIYTFPSIKWSMEDQIREYWPIFGNVYLDDRLFKAYDYINSNFPKNSKTISTFYSGNMLPAFTHTISFTGHFGYTYNYEKKDADITKFFSSKMTDQEAKALIMSNKIDLVFQGPEEKAFYANYLYPNILKTVYDWGNVTIYSLK
jgi:hypothetical protein